MLVACNDSVKGLNIFGSAASPLLKWGSILAFTVDTLDLVPGYCQHVLAPEEGWLGLRHQQELFDPLQQILASGCHLTRETGQLVKAAASGSPSR